eukprot:m.162567 g.162567  ORF g.162567 m.162567 type:complete len:94 (+) comp12212_c0_seq1:98-379(+)
MPSALEAIRRVAVGLGFVGVVAFAGQQVMKYTVPTNDEMMKAIPGAQERIEAMRDDNDEVYNMLMRSAHGNKPAWLPEYQASRKDSLQGNHKG